MTDPQRPDATSPSNRRMPARDDQAPDAGTSEHRDGARTSGSGRFVLLGAALFAVLGGILLFVVMR